MEQLNKIELRGNVGSVRQSRINGRLVVNFSVATNYVYKGKDGDPVIETTWHNISAWEGRNMVGLERIGKGSRVQVLGRLRSQKYTDPDGQEHSTYDVAASKVSLIEGDDILQYEFNS